MSAVVMPEENGKHCATRSPAGTRGNSPAARRACTGPWAGVVRPCRIAWARGHKKTGTAWPPVPGRHAS